jgi:hypothetical protein
MIMAKRLWGSRLAAITLRWMLWLACLPVMAEEKAGMPDLSQVEQTCLPTSTANLMIWFGHHGYPKLILDGATEDEADLHTVHRIMADTDARFDWGTEVEKVTVGINKYITDAGYEGDIEYRGLKGTGEAFSEDWLKENDDPNKGFILLLAYVHCDPQSHTFTPAWHIGHAVTLVNDESNILLIHDPAHYDDQPGRKIITPFPLTEGTWVDRNETAPVAGLALLSGSLLRAPRGSRVMLVGAVCVTMHPVQEGSSKVVGSSDSRATIGGTGGGAASDASSTKTTTWWSWLFSMFFEK